MRRCIAASMGVLLLAAVFASSSANLQAADKTVSGKVAAVSPDSITINARDEVVKLVVDTKTKVVGTGVGTKEAKLKEEKKSPQIVDFLKAGDEVSAKDRRHIETRHRGAAGKSRSEVDRSSAECGSASALRHSAFTSAVSPQRSAFPVTPNAAARRD